MKNIPSSSLSGQKILALRGADVHMGNLVDIIGTRNKKSVAPKDNGPD